MAEYFIPAGTPITQFSLPSLGHNSEGQTAGDITFSDNNPSDAQFTTSESLTFDFNSTVSPASYVGTVNVNGTDYHVFDTANFRIVFGIAQSFPESPSFSDLGPVDTSPFTGLCFAAGTLIATPSGDRPVESLRPGDPVLRADGTMAGVRWLGRQTVHKLLAGAGMQPVRIRAGALGAGIPTADLTVTADHGMVLDGQVINASALVNGDGIDWVPMAELPDEVTYYHVETEEHDIILANGAPAETFIDAAGRAAFDNHSEYLAQHGADRIVPEMPLPRIASARLLAPGLRARLGLDTPAAAADFPTGEDLLAG